MKRTKCTKDELRLKILNEASSAFRKVGIRSVHMDNIAGSLGISKRTLYELFKDKEQLLLEVLRFHHQEMNEYMAEVTSKADNVLEVIFALYKRRMRELCNLNPIFLRDLRRYPAVVEYVHARHRETDAAALEHFKIGVEQGIFRGDINFQIINQAMSMQFDMLVFSDITDIYPLADIFREITFLHMRGIATPKGMEMVNSFLQSVQENHSL
ncbi:TetR/AcrR family transcriptional regulator [uncultured Bacteroides sp.]|uniref:TetR/AcrR family transcriptional regulator n=1 Tax=uncultured Bacteroides sp. TaxID=162156 RepID=UPI0026383B82|nr:TetR/AcrR family transcriptional regulator [uncultured Bacteroides sp.]